MRTFIECTYCYLKQAVNCMKIANVNEERQYQILYRLMDQIKTLEPKRTPAENSTAILKQVYRLINNDDPYRKVKEESNKLALELYPRLKNVLQESQNRLYDALKIAVAGNVIDLGINRDFDIDASLRYSLQTGFSKDNFDIFSQKLDEVSEITVIGDNAGEIVFDKLLVEELAARDIKVIYIVKGGPILNDATLADAEQVGMNQVAQVITTGASDLGIPLQKVSPEVKSQLENAKLVISKGQANFESLEHENLARGRIFFLLKIKCECVAEVAQSQMGDVVFFTR